MSWFDERNTARLIAELGEALRAQDKCAEKEYEYAHMSMNQEVIDTWNKRVAEEQQRALQEQLEFNARVVEHDRLTEQNSCRQSSGSPYFNAILQRMRDIHVKKSHDYSSSEDVFSNFTHTASAVGCSVNTVFAVMIQIKMARLKELLGAGKVPKNESISDTLIDLANYCALWAAYDLKTHPQSPAQPASDTLSITEGSGPAPGNDIPQVCEVVPRSSSIFVDSVSSSCPPQVPPTTYATTVQEALRELEALSPKEPWIREAAFASRSNTPMGLGPQRAIPITTSTL